MIGLCQDCDRPRFIPDHSSTLQRTTPSGASCSTSSSYAPLHGPGARTENPGVGGSIPSLPTMNLSSDSGDLPFDPRTSQTCMRLLRPTGRRVVSPDV